jgi:hypothetical protein
MEILGLLPPYKKGIIMRVTWLLLLALTAALTANADLISSAGQVSVIAPPADVRVNLGIQSDTQSFFFTEQRNFILPSAVNVNITSAGTYTSNASLTPGTIAASTAVDSYYLHTDPVTTTNHLYVGSVTFNTQILGVIVLDALFNASNGTLGHTGTLYSASGQGLELGSPTDAVTVTIVGNTLSFDFATSTAADDIRIITAASVPEPSMLPILLLMCVGLCFAVMRRRSVPSTNGR